MEDLHGKGHGGYNGKAIRGSAPAIDTKRKQVYVATGNNYSVPDSVLECVAANEGDPDAIQACVDPASLFDSIVALGYNTGAIKWATKALPFDAWTVSCMPPSFGDGSNCPDPEGPDYDFGQAPALFTVDMQGKPRQNAAGESFNGKLRNECLSLEWFRNRIDASIVIEGWRRHQNETRLHSSLGYLTQAEFKQLSSKTNPEESIFQE